jgi:predicted heme/steroid binding protein
MTGCGFCQSGKTALGHLSWKGFVSAILVALVATLALTLPGVPAQAQEPTDTTCISQEEVAQAKDVEGKCLVIVEGSVYDVTQGKRWDLEGHRFSEEAYACGGTYAPEEIDHGPHDRTVMEQFKLGPLCEIQTALATPEPTPEQPQTLATTLSAWSQKTIHMSIFRLTAYLSLAAFVLNFLTCYAMPWARVRQPWEGERPGEDPKDQVGHFPLTHWHKYFAWAAIFFLSLHGFLGFACVWWDKCF